MHLLGREGGRPLPPRPRYSFRAARLLEQAWRTHNDPHSVKRGRYGHHLSGYLHLMASLPPYSPSEVPPLTRTQSKALANGLSFVNAIHTHPNSSSYTLRTIPTNGSDSPPSSPTDPLNPLHTNVSRNYGSTPTSARFPPPSPGVPSSRRPLLNAAIKMAVLFVVSCLVLGGTLWLALPTLDESVRPPRLSTFTNTLQRADRPMLHIPKSFDELQALNTLLKKYRDIYPYRIIICYVITYLLQVPSFLHCSNAPDASDAQPTSIFPAGIHVSFHTWWCCMGCSTRDPSRLYCAYSSPGGFMMVLC